MSPKALVLLLLPLAPLPAAATTVGPEPPVPVHGAAGVPPPAAVELSFLTPAPRTAAGSPPAPNLVELPLPGAMPLLLGALAGFAVVGRRRRHRGG